MVDADALTGYGHSPARWRKNNGTEELGVPGRRENHAQGRVAVSPGLWAFLLALALLCKNTTQPGVLRA